MKDALIALIVMVFIAAVMVMFADLASVAQISVGWAQPHTGSQG